jgi:uncharacterized membrane protein HdeD (DUF308 family)
LIIKRGMALAAAIAALMTAVACGLIALCFAVYALLRDPLTPAGASAAIVGLCAVVAGIAAFVAYSAVKLPRGQKSSRRAPPPTLAEQAMEVVRERPLVTAGVALAAGLAAFANPALVTAVLRAFTDRPRNRP